MQSQYPRHAAFCSVFSPEAASFIFILFCPWHSWHSVASHDRWTETFVTFHLLWMNRIRGNKWRSHGLSNAALLQRQFRWRERYERASHRVGWTAAVARSKTARRAREEKAQTFTYTYWSFPAWLWDLRFFQPCAMTHSSPTGHFYFLSWPVCSPFFFTSHLFF